MPNRKRQVCTQQGDWSLIADLNLLRLDGSDGVHGLQATVLRKGHGHRLQRIRERTHSILKQPQDQPQGAKKMSGLRFWAVRERRAPCRGPAARV